METFLVSGPSKLSVKFFVLLLALLLGIVPARAQTVADETAPAQAALREFVALLPDATVAQKAVLREFAVRDGVRLKPDISPDVLENWLIQTSPSAQTTAQKRAAMQDFLLVARELGRNPSQLARRLAAQSALAALALAEGDGKLRADISQAFLAPFALDAQPDEVAAWLEPLWPRYGRIIRLEVQSGADIAAMHKAAQTKHPDQTPPLQIEAGNALTLPFLQAMAQAPGPRRGWAVYRLARLFRARGETARAHEWFEKLEFGDGAGIFRPLFGFYPETQNPAVKPPGVQGNADTDEPPTGDELVAWEKFRALMSSDIATMQSRYLADLKNFAAQTTSPERARLYAELAEKLTATLELPDGTTKAHREATSRAEGARIHATVKLWEVDKAEGVKRGASQIEGDMMLQARELFELSHYPHLSGISWQSPSRADLSLNTAAGLVRNGDDRAALAALELASTRRRSDSSYGQALDHASKLMQRQGRLEDALLCLEAIPLGSGMDGLLVWSAPPLRKLWSEQVALIDPDATITEREPLSLPLQQQ